MSSTDLNNTLDCSTLVYLNAIELTHVMGKPECSLCLIDYWQFKVGERVKLVAKRVSTGEILGLYCYRYVKSIKPLEALYLNEDYVEVTFTAIDPSYTK